MFESRTTPATPTRADQNRLNALNSTGPRTALGKSISKLNAVKTGLTGRTVLLPTDDAARYEQHVQNWFKDLNPEGPRECALVQSIADSHWRTERIVRLEFALYAGVAGAESAAGHPTNDSGAANEGNELDTYLRYERQLRNLSTQESRLRRSRDKDMKELNELQTERRKRLEEESAAQAAAAKMAGKAAATVASTAQATAEANNTTARETGFVFATASSEPSHETTTNKNTTL